MSFTSLKGQNQAIEILRRYIAESRMQGGYLFAGPEGIGKKQAALTLAKALNCLSSSGDSCDRCSSCQKADKGEHPDIHYSGGADEIKIEDIRALQREMSLRAYEGRVKVFILDNAHAMTAESANALLKILEEPPANSVMILISDKPSLLFKTVVSRCRAVKFCVLPRAGLADILQRDWQVSPADAHCLAFFAEGRIGRALRLKESDFIADKNKVISSFMEPSTGRDDLDAGERTSVKTYITILATWFRDLYLCKTGAAPDDLVNSDRTDEVIACAERCSLESLQGLFSMLTGAMRDLDGNINAKLLMQTIREDTRHALKIA